MDAVEPPRVMRLCGSLRFQNLFLAERRRLTALSVSVMRRSAPSADTSKLSAAGSPASM